VRSRLIKITLSLVLFSFLTLLCWFYFLHYQEIRKKDPRYQVVAIALKSLGPSTLPSSFFAEVLELSTDQPTPLFDFSTDWAEQQLLLTPYLTQVRVERIKPSVIFIEYQAREAVARVGNYSLAAIDRDGVLFPYLPYTNYSHLPEVYFDLVNEPEWGGVLAKKDLQLFLNIEQRLQNLGVQIERLDLSRLEVPTLGRREILLTVQDAASNYTLRLPPQELDSALERYGLLKEHLTESDETIDLRLTDLAYIMEKS